MVYIHLYMGGVCIPVNYYLSNLCKWKYFQTQIILCSIQETIIQLSSIQYYSLSHVVANYLSYLPILRNAHYLK